MDLGQNINSSIDYTRKIFDDLGRLAILIILNIIPIIGQLIVVGYYARTVRETPHSDSPPKLEKYGDLFIDGLKIAVAAIIYMIIPAILIAVGALTLFVPFMDQTYMPGIWAFPFGFSVLLLVAGIILAFALAIIMTMALVNMIKTGNFGKAFTVGEIVKIIGKIGWGKYIIWLIVMFIFAAIVSAIGSVPAIGWLISLIIGPIFGVFASRSAALIYNDAVSPGTQATTSSEKKFCMSCGAAMPREATYCPACGKPQ